MSLSRHLRRARLRHAARKVDRGLAEAIADARVLGCRVADVMLQGRQPGRLFTMAEVEAAVTVAVTNMRQQLDADHALNGVPAAIGEKVAEACLAQMRSGIREGILATLPADVLATVGSA